MAIRTPLAWRNLTQSWRKCFLASSGVAFAVVLMFMQLGFSGALIENNVRLMSLFDHQVANLVVISRARYTLSTEQRFTRYLLEAIAGHPAVKDVMAVQLERGTPKVHVEGYPARPIRVIAVDTEHPQMLADPHLYRSLIEAQRQGGALVDRRSKPKYGFARDRDSLGRQHVELNGRRLPIVDLFELGTDFGNEGTLLMPTSVYSSYFPWRNPGGDANALVDIGLIHAAVQSDTELAELAAQLQQLAPQQIQVLPTTEFVVREKRFWARSTPIGKIFAIGTALGLVVGAIICYQILFTDITEHLPEFATLKAMGYRPPYFVQLILWQSLYLALLGFFPGWLISWGLYELLTATSGLIMSMPLERIALVWGLTMAMCVVSGLLAMRKLFLADPAELF